MLGKRHRLRSRRDFNRLYRQGKQVRSPNLALRSLPNHQAAIRIAVVVSAKINKRAVSRNRLRRRLRAQLKLLLPQIAVGYDLLIIPQHQMEELSPEELGAELTRGLQRSGLIKP